MKRPSLSLIVSCLALVVATSGTSYAAMQLPKHSVGAKQLKKGAVTLPKVAPAARAALRGTTGPRGSTGPTFGASKVRSSVPLTACTSQAAVSMPVTVTRPSRIFTSASAAWTPNGTSLKSGLIWVDLVNADDAIVATTTHVIGSDFGTASFRTPLSVGAVLGKPGSDADESTAYLAAPGNYTLELQAEASDGTCSGTSYLWYPQLTFVLLGTNP
ncbi:hypothetical protein [Nocardioides sp. Iso805N]|uniref:hypothetical protein n=1 Tax=Nocardioides sp. Iso805N TaxID=1283287 RepID=UPI000379FD7B|nr:hypothetical protein [Nocardioides sp. Iso805N]